MKLISISAVSLLSELSYKVIFGRFILHGLLFIILSRNLKDNFFICRLTLIGVYYLGLEDDDDLKYLW
jgi:hypothetical protein